MQIFKLEPKGLPVISFHAFLKRQIKFILIAFCLLLFGLAIGILGYRYIGKLDWVSSFYNASLILAGMGPEAPMTTTASKIFAGCYSIFSGIFFLTTAAVMLTPLTHRILHFLHFESDERE